MVTYAITFKESDSTFIRFNRTEDDPFTVYTFQRCAHADDWSWVRSVNTKFISPFLFHIMKFYFITLRGFQPMTFLGDRVISVGDNRKKSHFFLDRIVWGCVKIWI